MNSSYLNQIIAKLQVHANGGSRVATSLLGRLAEVIEDITNGGGDVLYAYQKKQLSDLSIEIAEVTGLFRTYLEVIPGYYGRKRLVVRGYVDGDRIPMSVFVNLETTLHVQGARSERVDPHRSVRNSYQAIKSLLADYPKNIFVYEYIHASEDGSAFGEYETSSNYAQLFHKRHHCTRTGKFNPRQVMAIDNALLTWGAIGVGIIKEVE